MKKQFIFLGVFVFALVIVLSAGVLGASFKVTKTSSNEVLVSGLNQPVTFDLNITSIGNSDSFSFYNLLGFTMSPTGPIPIGQSETKSVHLALAPIGNITQRGFYTISYYIKGSDGTQQQENLTFKIIDMQNAFQVGALDIDPTSQYANVYIKNLENFDFGKTTVEFSSPFFTKTETINDLKPKSTYNFTVPLNANFSGTTAGFYTIKADVTSYGKTAETDGTINFVEKSILTTTTQHFGLFINTNVIQKVNKGNTYQDIQTVIKKNIISRLFTSFNPSPDSVQRQGFDVYYTWTDRVQPGATFTITVKTNWFFPVLIVLLLVVIVVLAKRYSGTTLSLSKRVSFVKAKGGEFALKVTVFVTAKKHVERVNVVDRLPPLVKVYERFGSEKPTRIDEKNRRIEWNFETLNAGEVRVLSYIIYSKVGVMGKFALPAATALFEKNGQIKEEESNQAFFVAEQRDKDLPEED